MLIHLTPGFVFIANSLPKPLVTAILVHASRTFAFNGNQIHPLAWIFLYFLAYPTIWLIRNGIERLLEELEMRRWNARRVPSVYSRLPFGISILQRSLETFSHCQLAECLFEWQIQYGPTYSLGRYGLLTCEPDYIKSVLSTNFENFEKGSLFHDMLRPILGNGVFNVDGDIWKFHRAMTRPFFVKDRVTDFDIFDRHADIAVNKMIERFGEGEAIDFQDVMSRLTLDSATEFLFGSCVHSLSAPLPYPHNSLRNLPQALPRPSDRFATAFGEAQIVSAVRTRIGKLWPLAEIFKDKTKESMVIINEYIDPIIKEALEKKRLKPDSQKRDPSVPETLLDHLVRNTDDINIIRDEVINIMIAGRDTTMCALTFVLYCLSEHPGVLATLREEILRHVGPTRRPSYEDLKECKYLRAVINETLRLYPPVPVNIRMSIESTTWPAKDEGKPYYIPKQYLVTYSVFLMHRRKDLWGPDALEFDPNRFLDERVHKYLIPNPFIFLPFNAGPRICLGQQFAYNEISFVLVRLLQAFDTVTLDLEAQPPESRPSPNWKGRQGVQRDEKIWMKSHLTLYAYKGLWLRMKCQV